MLRVAHTSAFRLAQLAPSAVESSSCETAFDLSDHSRRARSIDPGRCEYEGDSRHLHPTQTLRIEAGSRDYLRENCVGCVGKADQGWRAAEGGVVIGAAAPRRLSRGSGSQSRYSIR